MDPTQDDIFSDIPATAEHCALSILIPTMFSRRDFLARMKGRLAPQITPNVELLIDADAGEMNGGASTGEKRQRLNERARGRYVVQWDDDDLVTEDAVSRVLAALESGPDCVGITGIIILNRDPRTGRRFIHSIKCGRWYEKDNVFYRTPTPLNPIRRDLSLQVSFKSVVFGEDCNFSQRIFPLLKTEVMIDSPIYLYEHRPRKPDVPAAGTSSRHRPIPARPLTVAPPQHGTRVLRNGRLEDV